METLRRVTAVAVIVAVLVFGYGVFALVRVADRVAVDIADLAASERAQTEKLPAPKVAAPVTPAKPQAAPVVPKPLPAAKPAPVSPAVKLQEIPKAQPLPAKPQVAAPSGGLVSWWKGEDDVKDSAGANHGVAQKGATFSAGRVGQALSFDGVDDFVNAGSEGSLDDIPVVTIDVWIFAKSFGTMPAGAKTQVGRIVAKQSGSKNLNGFNLALRGTPYSDLAFVRSFGTGIGAWTTPASSIQLERWHHVVVVYDSRSANNNPQFYIDGALQKTTVVNKPAGKATSDAASNLAIGARPIDDKTADCFFHGLIDELRIYSRPLTADEIRSSYDAGSTGKSETPPARQESVAPKPQSQAPKAAPAKPVTKKAEDPAAVTALELTRNLQVKRLINLKFHEAAGLSAQDFLALAPLPETKDALLIVNESFLGLFQQCKLLGVGVVEVFKLEKHENLAAAPSEKLYWRYGLEPGRTTQGLTVAKGRELFNRSKRLPATTAEILAVYAQHPDFLEPDAGLDAAGSAYDGNRSPHLSRRVHAVRSGSNGNEPDGYAEKKAAIREKAEKEQDAQRNLYIGSGISLAELWRREAGIASWVRSEFDALALEAQQKMEVVELGMGLVDKGHPAWRSPSFAK